MQIQGGSPMRAFLLVSFAALVVAIELAFLVGIVSVATERFDDRCVVSLTINTSMIRIGSVEPTPTSLTALNGELVEMRGRISAVRAEKNEIVVTENIKSWTFTLAKNGKVFINDQESKLADLKAGDDATVAFERRGQLLIASAVRSTRQ